MSRVAVIQMVSGNVLADNLAQAERLMAQAVSEGAQLLLLPENFALFDSTQLYELAATEGHSGVIQRWLAERARRWQVYILAGSLPLPAAAEQSLRVRSALLVFDPSGYLIGRYDKCHLFDAAVHDLRGVYRESRYIEPGTRPVWVQTALARIGLSICFDLRFPDHFQWLRQQGAEYLVVPSAFTQATGQAHWQVLLQARAIENQCFVLAANQGGQHGPDRVTFGHSMIINPWGEILACHQSGEGIALADLDLAQLRRVRQRMPL